MRDTKMKNVRHFLILAILIIALLASGCEASTSALLVTTTPTADQVAEEASPESTTPELLTPTGTTMNKTTALPEVAEEIVTPESPPLTTTPVLLATATPTAAVGQELTTKTPTPISPTLTFTPSPTALPEEPTPSPAAKALPTLDEDLQTIVFTSQGEQGPEIWRMQVDEQGQQAGSVMQVDFPTDSRTRIYDLFPSPDGKHVAVVWFYGDGMASFVHILNVPSGQLTPLFGAETDTHPAVTFLDWSPDGQRVLVMGVSGNPDLRNSAWLVNVNTHTYHDINIKQVKGRPYISDASFSPDGKMIAYAQSDCSQCGSEIWRITLDNSERQLLFQDSKTVIADVLWSPDGSYIAFTTEPVGVWDWEKFIIGELHMMKTNGNEERLLSPIATYFFNQPFRPVWSPNSQEFAFVMSENFESEQRLDELSSNIYVADVLSNQVHQLTQFQNIQVVRPVWSPDGLQMAFLTSEKGSTTQFKSRIIAVENRKIRPPGVDDILIKTLSNNLDMQASFAWLP